MNKKEQSGYLKPKEKQNLPRSLRKAFSHVDFEREARKRLPWQIYTYYYSAVEERATYDANRAIFNDYNFIPNSLVDTSNRHQRIELFGQTWDRPFGIAPLGLSALATFDGDVVLARTASELGMPSIMSAASLTPLEDVANCAPNRWFQTYLPGEVDRIDPMMDRVEKAGFETLVLTVDVQESGNPENQIREGFGSPLPKTPSLAWQFLSHPRWLFGTMVKTYREKGMPHFENMDAQRGPPIVSRNDLGRDFGQRDGLNWDHAMRIRDRWKGKFIIKGILSSHDTELAKKMGADGVIVSNHGGRQLDSAISSLATLPDCVAAAGDMPVMVDSGFRRGTDILKAYALGASFVFMGRPFLYAASVAGAQGVTHFAELVTQEISRNMAMLGINDISSENLAPLIKKK